MKASKRLVILSLLNLIFLGLIVMDTFILKPTTTGNIIQKMDLKIGRSKTRTVLHYQVIDTKENKYEVPYSTFSDLKPGDSLIISRSGLFNKALFLSYHKDNVRRTQDVGLLTNSGFAVYVITIIGILLLLALLLQFLPVKQRFKTEVPLMMTFVNLVLIGFYFFKQA